MMNKISFIGTLLFLFLVTVVSGQEKIVVTGKVYHSVSKTPLAQVRVAGSNLNKSAITDEEGAFQIEVADAHVVLTFELRGFMQKQLFLGKRTQLEVYLLPENTLRYTNKTLSSAGILDVWDKKGSSFSINRKDLYQGNATPDESIYGMIPGVSVLSKGGMPGEGAVINLHGIRSLVSSNMPLMVVDGVPYIVDNNESQIISGFSRNVYGMINQKDIESISFLKGADALKYGAMGSNGVLVINTEKATDLETKVEFHTVDGVSWMNTRMPLMDAGSFKSYIGDIGETVTFDMAALVDQFPFLKDDPSYHYNYVYDNNTDWQEEIYDKAISTENMLKIKGGDAIANYMLTVGYMNTQGVLKNTKDSRYYARFNANMNITQRLKMFASVGFSYNETDMLEQGISPKTNPILASFHKSPLFSVYEKNEAGRSLGTFSKVETYVNGVRNPRADIIGVSNPAALVSQVEENGQVYNVLVNLGLDYQFSSKFKIGGVFGLYYNYNHEQAFIGGKSSLAIAPLSEGLAKNTVRSAVNQGRNIYFNGFGEYHNVFRNIHQVDVMLGYQMLPSHWESDCGTGTNTSSDFYKTLNSVTGYVDKNIFGYINTWNWMNIYAQAQYDYKHQLFATLGLTADASSSTGENAALFKYLPSVQAGIRFANTSLLREVRGIDELTLRGEYSQLTNSRYSSHYSKYYYSSKMFREITGLVRGNLPNTKLKPEAVHTTTIGLDFATLARRLSFSAEIFEERTQDMLTKQQIAPVYGFGHVYDNAGEIKTRGIDFSLQASLIQNKNFEWAIGGNITHYKSEIVKLGKTGQEIIQFSDGTMLLNKVGETPYQFYGYQAEKVIASEAEAKELALESHAGVRFSAGDIQFRNLNGDNRIDEKDLVCLGTAAPDIAGGFFTYFRYKGFDLMAQFTYSYGNKIYNATRRSFESLNGYENQSSVAERRWSYDGQQTDIPRAVYGDAIGNSRFSSRWVEDGSYLKLKNVTLGYTFTEKVGFFNQIQLYLTAQNLFTLTKYIGFDPEFRYSYSPEYAGFDLCKFPLAKSVRLGVKLNF